MNNKEAKQYLQKILQIANSRECCDVEIDAFYEEAIKTAISALGAIEQIKFIKQMRDATKEEMEIK